MVEPGETPRLVLFDLDDTLVDHTEAVAGAMRALQRRFPELRLLDVPTLVRRYNAHLRSVHASIVRGQVDADAARLERLGLLFAAVGSRPPRSVLLDSSRVYRSAYRASRRRLPGALAVLRRVKREASVGILTNNRRREQVSKLREFGLSPFVDFLATSEGTPWSKPDPELFRYAVRLGGVDVTAATMVGDSWVDDVEGAVSAGLRAVWLNRWARPVPRHGRNVRTLRSFVPVTTASRVVLGR